MANILLCIEKQQGAEHREKHHHDQPCDFRSWIHGTVQQIQDHENSGYHNASIDMGQECFKPVEDAEQEQDLYGKQQQDQPGTAEDHPEYTLLSLFQQAQPSPMCIVFHDILLSLVGVASSGLQSSSRILTQLPQRCREP